VGVGGRPQAGEDEQVAADVGQDVDAEEAEIAHADRARRLDELFAL
jgi:hypothetical protein